MFASGLGVSTLELAKWWALAEGCPWDKRADVTHAHELARPPKPRIWWEKKRRTSAPQNRS